MDNNNEDVLIGMAIICMIGKLVVFSIKATILTFIVIGVMKLFGAI